MADKGIMVDSTILIDYFRKTDKSRTRLVSLFKEYGTLYISAITEFEVVTGATKQHLEFWDGMLERFTVLDFDSRAARKSADIVAALKPKRKSIDKPDLFIAATAIVNGLNFDTLNRKHFIDIEELTLLDL
jgi:tRNA(fMet)-specific endonuclease VapC